MKKSIGQKIQLMHPTGKRAVRIDTVRYEQLKTAILTYLKSHGESTHSEIFEGIGKDLRKNNKEFEGSPEWYLEWVRLDLEARKVIKRIRSGSTSKFILS